ncbi:MAG: 1,4-alpha-glucan branching protein GlgB [Hyphomicrobiales bacterium]
MSSEHHPAPDAGGSTVRYGLSQLSADDLYFFNEGSHFQLYDKLGARIGFDGATPGVHFAVWAPNARKVSVIGNFNGWDRSRHGLQALESSGIWEGFIPDLGQGELYKYFIESNYNGYQVEKTDPFSYYYELAPKTASIVWDLGYQWGDDDWMSARGERPPGGSPISVYEIHLGSWRRVPEDGNRVLTYRELAEPLAEYVRRMGFTHVEFLPVMEHPFYGSWGYQTLGLFAPTSRYGTPQDFMQLIDHLHRSGIGVILDWVPSHFPSDEHGLGFFDGTHLYEHEDPRQGVHPDWKSLIYNYGRNEVRSFLISAACFWLDWFHADGLRVDAVASMLYLDYSRRPGEWMPNEFGGRENLQAISFLRRLNETVKERHPDVLMMAEESTAWPMVSRPAYVGGLGFDMKWDMGWMHDTLEYMGKEPVHRSYHHGKLNFRMIYAFSENFVLPLSHDEVVHGKGSLIGKMPGDDWQRFANLRLLLAYQIAQPGKKLLFMGGEFGQWREWDHDTSLDWHLLDFPLHAGLQRWVADLNRMYREEPALHRQEFTPDGFRWIDCNDHLQSTLSLMRFGGGRGEELIGVFNFTPVPRHNYRVGAPAAGLWKELLNSDARDYGGSGQGGLGGVEANPVPSHGFRYSLNLVLPPLGAVFYKQGMTP